MALKTKLTDLRPARERYARQIELISRGYFRPDCFPDGKITVYPWDSNIDAWLANIGLKQKKKRLTFDLVAKLANLNGCPVEEFLSSEVLLILMASRSLNQANKVNYNAVCPHCGHEHYDQITVPEELEKIGEKPLGYQGTDLITLPESSDLVEVRPLRIADEITLLERDSINDALLGTDVPEAVAKALIGLVSVGGGKPDNVSEVVSWYRALPPGDAEYLLEQVELLQPSVNQNLAYVCDSCGGNFTYTLRLDEDFFRRSGSARLGGKVATPYKTRFPESRTLHQPAGSAGSDPTKDGRVAQRTRRGATA